MTLEEFVLINFFYGSPSTFVLSFTVQLLA